MIALRIGDPDTTVEGRDATYVISYVIAGALRTFDGQPEVFWDVTGEDYPDIENFTIRVTAPRDVKAPAAPRAFRWFLLLQWGRGRRRHERQQLVTSFDTVASVGCSTEVPSVIKEYP